MRTRIKICGLTRLEDAEAAVAAGADAIGLIFYPGSSRLVTIETAQKIATALPAFVSSVALFVNASPAEVERVITNVKPALLQFHGDESEVFCKQFYLPYIRAVRVAAGVDLLQLQSEFESAKALLLDSLVDGHFGGTGQSFDWDLIPDHLRQKIILSGGLTAETVRLAVQKIRPYAVDVSSGVELAKGIKDHMKVRQFIEEVRRADAL